MPKACTNSKDISIVQDHYPTKLFAHTVTVKNNTVEPIKWCDLNVPEHEWSFWLEIDPSGEDIAHFEFAHKSTATQFALLFD